jgi:hypothetical protein
MSLLKEWYEMHQHTKLLARRRLTMEVLDSLRLFRQGEKYQQK